VSDVNTLLGQLGLAEEEEFEEVTEEPKEEKSLIDTMIEEQGVEVEPDTDVNLQPVYDIADTMENPEEEKRRIEDAYIISQAFKMAPRAAYRYRDEMVEGMKHVKTDNGYAKLLLDTFAQSFATKTGAMAGGLTAWTPGEMWGFDPLLLKTQDWVEGLQDPAKQKIVEERLQGPLWPVKKGDKWTDLDINMVPEVLGNWGVQIIDYIPLMIMTYGAQMTSDKLAGLIASTIPVPVLSQAVHQIIKHGLAAQPMIMLETGHYLDQAKEMGVDPDIAEKYARWYGLGSGTIEYLQNVHNLEAFKGVKDVLQKTIFNRILNHLGVGFLEGGEEMSQGVYERALMNKMIDEQAERDASGLIATPEELKQNILDKEQLTREGAIGTVIGLTMRGGGAFSNKIYQKLTKGKPTGETELLKQRMRERGYDVDAMEKRKQEEATKPITITDETEIPKEVQEAKEAGIEIKKGEAIEEVKQVIPPEQLETQLLPEETPATEFKQKTQKAFNITEEQADAVGGLIEEAAKAKGVSSDEFIATHISDVTEGGEPSVNAMYKSALAEVEEQQIPEYMERHAADDNVGYTQDIVDFVKEAKKNQKEWAVQPNSKTLLSIDFTTDCVMRKMGAGCAYCYVDQGRAKQELLRAEKGEPEFQYPQTKAVIEELSYTDQILKMPQPLIDFHNSTGGLRMFSRSDFEEWMIPHIDKVLEHAEKRGLQIKAITKERSLEFVKKYGNHPNMNIDVSTDFELAPGYVGEWGRYISNAAPIAEVEELRKEYPRIKIRYMAVNLEDAITAALDDRIDVVTMYHGATEDLPNLWRVQHPHLFEMLGEENVKKMAAEFENVSPKIWERSDVAKKLEKLLKDDPDKAREVLRKFDEKLCCQTGRCGSCPICCAHKVGTNVLFKTQERKRGFVTGANVQPYQDATKRTYTEYYVNPSQADLKRITDAQKQDKSFGSPYETRFRPTIRVAVKLNEDGPADVYAWRGDVLHETALEPLGFDYNEIYPYEFSEDGELTSFYGLDGDLSLWKDKYPDKVSDELKQRRARIVTALKHYFPNMGDVIYEEGADGVLGEGIPVEDIITPEAYQEIVEADNPPLTASDILEKLGDGKPVASIEFEADGRAIIRAFAGADLNALVHELGHVFRRVLDPEAMKVVEKWAGVKNGEWTVTAEEKFAEGFEKYLKTGKAPSSKLAEIFQKFKEWLSNIYMRLRGSLPLEVREAYDTLFVPPTSVEEVGAFFEERVGKEIVQVIHRAYEGETFDTPPMPGYVFRGTTLAEYEEAKQKDQYLGQFWASDPREAVTAAGDNGIIMIAKQSGSVRLNGSQITGMTREQQETAYKNSEIHYHDLGFKETSEVVAIVRPSELKQPPTILSKAPVETSIEFDEKIERVQKRYEKKLEKESVEAVMVEMEPEADEILDVARILRDREMDAWRYEQEFLNRIADLGKIKPRYFKGAEELIQIPNWVKAKVFTQDPNAMDFDEMAQALGMTDTELVSKLGEYAGIEKPSMAIRDYMEEAKRELSVDKAKYVRTEAAKRITEKGIETGAKRGITEGKKIGIAKEKARKKEVEAKARARKAKSAELKKMVKKLKDVAKKLDKFDPAFADPIREIIEGVDLVKHQKKTVVRLEKMREYLENNPDAELPEQYMEKLKILDKRPFGEISIEEWREIYDTVMHYAHLNTVKKQLKIGRRNRELAEVIEEAMAVMKPAEQIEEDIIDWHKDVGSKAESLGKKLKNIFGMRHNQYMLILEKLFGMNTLPYKVFGTEVKKGLTIQRKHEIESGKVLQDMITKGFESKNLQVDDIWKWSHEKVKAGKITLTRQERIALWCHWQNEDNRTAFLEGGFGTRLGKNPDTIYQFDEGQFKKIFDSLEEEEIAVGKAVIRFLVWQGDLMEPVFLEKNGYRMPRVKGVYYPKDVHPVAYANIDIEEQSALEKFRGMTLRPGVYKGMLIERVGSKKAVYLNPVFYDIAKSVKRAAAYIGLEIPFTNAGRLLYNDIFKTEMRKRYGIEMWKELEFHLRDMVLEYKSFTDVESIMMKIKNNLAVSVLGLDPFIMVKQIFSGPLYADYVKPQYLAKAMADYVADPKGIKEQIKAFSVEFELRTRGGFERDVADVYKKGFERQMVGGKRGFNLQSAKEVMMMPIKFTDTNTVAVGMHAAVLQVIDEIEAGHLSREVARALDMKDSDLGGLTPERKLELAYEYADYATERSQPSFLKEHQSSLQKGTPVEKFFTMFSSFTNQALNEIRRSYNDYKTAPAAEKKAAMRKLATAVFVLGVINPLAMMGVNRLRDLAYGREGDDEWWVEWLQSISSYIYGVRDIAFVLPSKIKYGPFGHDLDFNILQPFNLIMSGTAKAMDALTESNSKKRKEKMLKAIDQILYGSLMLFGFPYYGQKKMAENLLEEF